MEFFIDHINSWGQWLYIGIAVAMLIEGNITVLVVGFLASGGAVNPGYGILSCLAGGFVEQLLWFGVGLRLKNSRSAFTSELIRASNHFDRHFQHRPRLSLFISKFIYGVHRVSVARVAMLDLPLKKFIKYSLPVLFAWSSILFVIGFSVSKPVLYLFQDYVKLLGFALLGLVIIIVLLERYVLSGRLKEFWNKL